jgi:hypothetical protein
MTPAEQKPRCNSADAGRAIIEVDCIVIRVPLASLPMVVDGAWATGNLKTRLKITNIAEFAADIVHELNHESEDGTTLVHRMFDKAMDEAVNQGAQGIEEHEEQEP